MVDYYSDYPGSAASFKRPPKRLSPASMRFNREISNEPGLMANPAIDPVNILAGFGSVGATQGIGSAMGVLPGMMASEVPVGLGIEKVEEMSGGNPVANTIASVGLPLLAGKFVEPHINRMAGVAAEITPRLLADETGSIKFGKELPFTAEPQRGYHLTNSDIPNDAILPTQAGKENTYSRGDVGNRVADSTEGNPYSPRAYFYTAGTHPETTVRSSNKNTMGVAAPENILDLSKGTPKELAGLMDGYLSKGDAGWGITPGAKGNAVDNALKDLGYNGLMAPNGIAYSFGELPVSRPVSVTAGMSDVIETKGISPKSLSEAEKIQANTMPDFVNRVNATVSKNYPDIRMGGATPTIANFPTETGGAIEPGMAVKLEGPIESIMSAIAEIGTQNHQRQMFIVGDDVLKKVPSAWEGVRITGEFDRGKSLDEIEKLLAKHGVNDYNIVKKYGDTYGVDIFAGSPSKEIKSLMKDLRFPKVSKSYSVMLGSDTASHDNIKDSFDNYAQQIGDYFGKTRGADVFNAAAETGRKWKSGK